MVTRARGGPPGIRCQTPRMPRRRRTSSLIIFAAPVLLGVTVAACSGDDAAGEPALSPQATEGRQIVRRAGCVACHGAGIANAPKLGDKAAWAPRIKNGVPTLYNAALKGMGVMPPKGGNPSLSDADVKAAVDYMVAAAK